MGITIKILQPLRVFLYKSFLSYLVVSLVFYTMPVQLAYANPQDGVVSDGAANINTVGDTLYVDQSTDKAVIDWNSFNIDANETTQFNQPSSSAITLNRIGDTSPSQIFGTLTANGNIVLLNSNGILFGTNSSVNVNSIVASTASISNSDFMAGNYNFTNAGDNPEASIINQGTITAADAGLIGLVAPNVTNSGTINARLGMVHLASGDSFTLDLYGDGLLEIGVSDAVSAQVVRNTGTINAAGGIIKMTAAAGRQVVNSLIDVQGTLHAPSVAAKNGKIYIYAEGSNGTSKSGESTVDVSGTLNTTGNNAGETGGEIDVLGDNVFIRSGAVLDASGDAGGGTVLIGGDYQGLGEAANAVRTVIEDGALVLSDALSVGDGGKVIVWADDSTSFNGKINAKGGAQDGDGGFVETSGKKSLGVGGEVNASSALGAAGKWLLDPQNVIIQAAAKKSTTDNSYVTTGSIETSLNSGTNVEVMTSASAISAKLGDITLSNSITKSSGSDATLTLKAVGSIIVNNDADITSTFNKLNIILTSNSDSSTTTGGAISIKKATLDSNGGDITLGGGDNASTAAYGTKSNSAGIKLSGSTLNSDAGNITLRGNGDNNGGGSNIGVNIAAGSVVTTTSGDINISGTGGEGGTRSNIGVYVNGTSIVQSTGSGNITVAGQGGAGTSSNHGVYVASGSKINMADSSTGSLTVTGTGGSSGVETTNKSNYGVVVSGVGSEISSSKTSGAGIMTVTGTAADGYSANIGVAAIGGGVISSTIDNLNVTGNGGNGINTSNYGVYVKGTNSAISSTNGGNLAIIGNAGTGTSSNIGVYVVSSGQINSFADLTVTGTGNGTTTSNHGVYVTGANSAISSNNGGNLVITGNSGSGTSSNIGVYAASGATISSDAGLSVTGTGNGAGASNYGVYVTGANSTIISNRTTGKGDFTITGTGGAGTNKNYGVAVAGKATISTINDNLVINGTGGDGSLSGNYGVYLAGAVTSTGSGGLEINSSAKENAVNDISNAQDIYLTSGAAITGSTGAVSLNAEGLISIAAAQLISTSGGSVALHGNVNLANTLNVDTTNSDENLSGGDVTFGGTVDGTKALTVTAGSDGVSTFNGVIGGTKAIGALNITSGGGIAFNQSVTASTIFANTTTGTKGDITIGSGATISATAKTGDSIVLASGRNFINNSDSYALSNANKSRSLIYSTTPENDVLGGLDRPTKRYNRTFDNYSPNDVTESGNVFLYSIAPVINITGVNASNIYGDSLPTITQTVSGLIDNDLANVAYTGTEGIARTLATNTSNAGAYNILADKGTIIATELGYQVQEVNGILTIEQASLTIAADAQIKTEGEVDPGFTYVASGFKNNDAPELISGNLSRDIGENANTYLINQGDVAAGTNYKIDYIGSNLVINPASVVAAVEDITPVVTPVVTPEPVNTPIDKIVTADNTKTPLVVIPKTEIPKAIETKIVQTPEFLPPPRIAIIQTDTLKTQNSQQPVAEVATNTAISSAVDVTPDVQPITDTENQAVSEYNVELQEQQLVSSSYITLPEISNKTFSGSQLVSSGYIKR